MLAVQLDKYSVLSARGNRRYHNQTANLAVPLGHHHPRAVVLPLAVSPRPGMLSFNVHATAGCSSLLPTTDDAGWAPWCKTALERRTVPAISLAEALSLAGHGLDRKDNLADAVVGKGRRGGDGAGASSSGIGRRGRESNGMSGSVDRVPPPLPIRFIKIGQSILAYTGTARSSSHCLQPCKRVELMCPSSLLPLLLGSYTFPLPD